MTSIDCRGAILLPGDILLSLMGGCISPIPLSLLLGQAMFVFIMFPYKRDAAGSFGGRLLCKSWNSCSSGQMGRPNTGNWCPFRKRKTLQSVSLFSVPLSHKLFQSTRCILVSERSLFFLCLPPVCLQLWLDRYVEGWGERERSCQLCRWIAASPDLQAGGKVWICCYFLSVIVAPYRYALVYMPAFG